MSLLDRAHLYCQPGNRVFLLAERGSLAPEHGDVFAEKVGRLQTRENKEGTTEGKLLLEAWLLHILTDFPISRRESATEGVMRRQSLESDE